MMPATIIGIMSGSSLDGLDMALCRFEEKNETISWDILKAQTIPFPEHLLNALNKAPSMSGFDLMQLDADLGKFIGLQIDNWISKNDLTADYIASHGHTVFHEPAKGFTTQIGSGAHIAFETGIDTITSFRNADVAAGGQGAPFAPVADKNLFPGYKGYIQPAIISPQCTQHCPKKGADKHTAAEVACFHWFNHSRNINNCFR